jgi:hypothetical protein
MRDAIFWPMAAQVAIVAAVWVRLGFVRIGEMKAKRIHPQAVATTRSASQVLEDVGTADNFRNLFEVPVLFFAVCLALAITDLVSPLQVALAWVFVAMRAVHSFIHTTYNKVMHRFMAFLVSTLCVFAMWIVFAVSLALR